MNAVAGLMQRTTAIATPDLLNWAAEVADGVVLCKDGSLLAGWHYRGPDLAGAPATQRNQVCAAVNAALAGLGSEWMIHVDAGRREATGYPAAAASAFPDAVTRLIDEERRAVFEAADGHFETAHALVVTFLPPKSSRRRAVDLVFSDDDANEEAAGDAVLRAFEAAVGLLEDRLSAVLELVRMRGVSYEDADGRAHVFDPLLSHLKWTLTGEAVRLNLPPCPMYLDAVVGAEELWTGVVPRIGERFVTVVAIDGFPLETFPGILAELDVLPVEYRWSTRFICTDALAAQAELRGYRRRWQQKVRGFWDQVLNRSHTGSGVVDADAQEMVGETEEALAEASSGLVGFGAFTSVVVLSDPDRNRLATAAREVRRVILNLGFGARIETVNTVEGWLGSLPGHAAQNLRRPLLHTVHLANLLPLSSVWPGSPTAPCPMYPEGSPALLYAATGSTPFRLNLHVGDVGHTLMFGPTGAGKSTALALIAAQFRRYRDATVFAFDVGRSMEVLTRAVGGGHFDLGVGDDDGPGLAPLAGIDDAAERTWAADWIDLVVELQGLGMSASQRNEVGRALAALAAKPAHDRTLTAVQVEIQDAAVKEALQPYTVNGTTGGILDAEEDGIRVGTWACFEVGELMNRDDKVRLPVLLYLFRMVERSLRGQPAILVVDEAWTMLGNEVFRGRIRDWLKTLRKSNAAVLLATQSLSDAAGSGILDVLVESCATQIFLANPAAEQPDAADLYRSLGLNDAEVELVRSLTPKRQYYVRGAGRRVVDLAIGPVALSFVGVNSREDRDRVRELATEHGPRWPRVWLEERGVRT